MRLELPPPYSWSPDKDGRHKSCVKRLESVLKREPQSSSWQKKENFFNKSLTPAVSLPISITKLWKQIDSKYHTIQMLALKKITEIFHFLPKLRRGQNICLILRPEVHFCLSSWDGKKNCTCMPSRIFLRIWRLFTFTSYMSCTLVHFAKICCNQVDAYLHAWHWPPWEGAPLWSHIGSTCSRLLC